MKEPLIYPSVRRECPGTEDKSKGLIVQMSAAWMCTRKVSIFGMRLNVPYYCVGHAG